MKNPALAKRGNPETDLANLAASSINPEYATAVLKVQAVHLTRRCVMSLGMAAVVEQAVEAAGFASKNVQEHIWQMPARYVGSYAEADAASTLALFEKLNPILDRERTREAYRLEVALLPPVLELPSLLPAPPAFTCAGAAARPRRRSSPRNTRTGASAFSCCATSRARAAANRHLRSMAA